jgi:hypothetical protein
MAKQLTPFITALAIMTCVSLSSAQVAEVALENPTVQAVDGSNTPGFNGTSHTGSLLFTPNSTTFAFLSFNDVQQPVAWAPFTSPALTAVTGSTLPAPYATAGELILVNGNVAGGEINVVLSNGDTFSTTVRPNSGSVIAIAGGFAVTGELSSASFSGPTFGGYDVSDFVGTYAGSFNLTNFSPDGQGADDSNQLDLRLNVPEPASIALIGLGGLLLIARRR